MVELWPMLKPVLNIAFVGNYSPRICGIATFTTDLCEATNESIALFRSFCNPFIDVVKYSSRKSKTGKDMAGEKTKFL